ncbi:MAG: gliding motility-associated C-terminal domain-containing protein [Bacteroidetes bacterium]|nr:gliding motility-associated C-terminal domain-containing protein [Bacteroidota bacterium]
MRAIALIFCFTCSTFLAQVSAPDLRCLSVLPNGDITLSWIPPSDPGGVFFAYEIFTSISSSGPFSSLITIPAISTTSFTHVGAGGNVQSKYYFIKSRYGGGGVSSSPGSDTLRSIFLNIITGVPDLKLLYNNIHQPKLNSSSTTFTINKEFPSATWNIFAITSALSYADTLSVCSASINYQVALGDNSGCVSTSNVQGGIYNDKKNPNTPSVDSISVLPNGQTVLAWTIPRDPDIVKYFIYENIGGINTAMDSVNGRPSTLYTFTATLANSGPLAIYVSALDSCRKLGGFDIQPTTMYLKANYDKCGYKTLLTWNPYQGMRSGVLEYRIYYSVNGGAFIRVGTTTQTAFTHNNVIPGQNICYFVRVINNAQNITSSSNRTCFFSSQVQASGFVYISNATVVDNSTNRIDMFIDVSKVSVGVDVWRSVNGVSFSNIGFTAFSGSPYLSFTDDKAETKNTSYYYRAVVRDSCGNARTSSNISKTILLKVKEDPDHIFTKYLSWTDYKGYAGGVSGYNVFRVVNGIAGASPVGFTGTGDTLFVDELEEEAPNGSKINYFVQAVEGIGDSYGFLEASNSNNAEIYMEGRLYVPNAFSPKGKNKVWIPVTHFVDKTEYSVTVFNRWGNKVFETSDDTKGWDGANSPPDVYAYLIRYKNSRGEYSEMKGTIYLME